MFIRRAITACLVIAAVGSIILMASRAASVVRAGTAGDTTGYEIISLNSVYRTAIGVSPYVDLNRNATPALFNGLFYLVYGGVARMRGVDAGPVPELRLLSLVFIGVAVLAFAAECAKSLHDQGAGGWPIGAAVGLIALAGPTVGWWALTVRPDAGALCAETLGLIALRRAAQWNRRSWWFAAGACALIALAFKQNAAALAIVLLSAMAARHYWRWCTVFVVAAGVVVGLLRLWGGPHYFFHTVMIAANSDYAFTNIGVELGKAIIAGWPLLVLPLLVVRRARVGQGPIRMTALMYVVAVVIALPQLARLGASRNYLFAAGMSGALLLTDYAGWLVTSRRVVIAAAAGYMALATVYLVATAPVLTTAEPSLRLEHARIVRAAPVPRFVEDVAEALPWQSGDANAETIDDTVYWSAIRRGIIKDTVYDRIGRRYYASVFAFSPEFHQALEAAGYVRVLTIPEGMTYYRRPDTY